MKAIYCLSCDLRTGCLSGAAAPEIARTGGSVNDRFCLKKQAKKKADSQSRKMRKAGFGR